MSLKRFGTFEGVFVPSLLSILGVIMYLRLGWVVGSLGLGGALLIIVISNMISLATGLSISSIVTNIRIGHGGAHSIITKSLGVEAGGAIGIPLYFSQAISVAFYIAGFSECWKFVFPGHDILAVALIAWIALLIVSYCSAKLAFRIQFLILAAVGVSLFSMALGKVSAQHTVTLWTNFSSGRFLAVFAVFFPAVTGILSGVTMSGELKDPRKSIPLGTLGAIFVSFVVYMGVAWWFSSRASSSDLAGNTSIVVTLGRWQWMIVAGIMGATISSALNMFVTAPRTLFALSRNNVLPLSSPFTRTNEKGEPRTAILFTSLIALATILCGTLNQVAVLLTMFFLITYATINLSVFIEQSIGIASFRPSLKVPRIVPFVGGVGCLVTMFLINPVFSMIAFCIITFIYFLLIRRETSLYSPDVRSGLLIFISEQMAKAAARLPYHPKIWKPNLLIPVNNIDELSQVAPLIKAIVCPSGRVIAFTVIDDEQKKRLLREKIISKKADIIFYKKEIEEKLSSCVETLKDEGVLVKTTVVEAASSITGVVTVLQTTKGMHFPPNTLFCILSDYKDRDAILSETIKKAAVEDFGIIILKHHPQKNFGRQEVVNLWIRKGSPNIDLSILISLQLNKNWDGHVRILQAVDDESEKKEAVTYLSKLRDLMRLPIDVSIDVLVGKFREVLKSSPEADINIFGMPEEPDLEMIRTAFDALDTSVLFLRDSKHESAVA